MILGCAARDASDETALEMLHRILDPAVCQLEIVSTDRLVSEVVELVAEERPSLVCIASLPPGGLAHTRLLCKRLRSRYRGLKIVVGRWGLQSNIERNRDQLMTAGADHFATTLHDSCTQIVQLGPFLNSQKGLTDQAAASPAVDSRADEKSRTSSLAQPVARQSAGRVIRGPVREWPSLPVAGQALESASKKTGSRGRAAGRPERRRVQTPPDRRGVSSDGAIRQARSA